MAGVAKPKISDYAFLRLRAQKCKRYAYLSALHFLRPVFVLSRSVLWGGARFENNHG